MKPRLFILLLVCASAFSCVKERIESSGGEGAAGKTRIGFTTGVETRAAALTDPAGLAAKGGFNVWVYSHIVPWDTPPPSKGTILDGATVTGNSGGTLWSYDNPAEWPADRYVSFFACGPADAVTKTGNTAGGVPIVDFTVNSEPGNQTDLLIARPLYDQVGPTYANGAPVNIHFKHALSRIVFSGIVMNETETRVIRIKSITVSGLYDTGSAALSVNPIEWTVDEEQTASYTVSMATGGLSSVTPLSAESKYVTTETGFLFLMPQSLVREPDKEPTMKVTLDIDGAAVEYPVLPLFSPSVWQPGKTYNYQVVVDGDDLHVIGVDDENMTLKEWEIAEYINPVMMVPGKEDINNRKINAAMEALELLSRTGYPIKASKYFALYFSGAMDMDVTVDMSRYPYFDKGDVVMLDAKKLVTKWDYIDVKGEGDEALGTGNYTLKVELNGEWILTDAAQPAPDLWSDPQVDAISGPTTQNPSSYIRNRGSIVLEKITDRPPLP